MANYYVIGLSTVIILTILCMLYDSFDMDMYRCADIKQPSATSTGITRLLTSRGSTFNMTGNDVLVCLHIQKTGGSSFGRHLVHDLDLKKPCQCKKGVKTCQCLRPGSDREPWLFSEFSMGWSCGLHADWTELTHCVPSMLDKYEGEKKKRRYFYLTILRDPLSRYLSEWRHVQRGATWKTSMHMCDGRVPSSEELPSCYLGIDWTGVTLKEFLGCRYNLANNRQTRMLADLTAVGCYNLSQLSDAERRAGMLESAKRNLKRLAFFGILEYQKETQQLFEATFGLKFQKDFVQFDATKGTAAQTILTEEQKAGVHKANAEDFLLYDYAKKLFLDRVAALNQNRKRRTPLT
ncbi:heparan-sulfate 6-O-sulfotransferase 3-like [Acanthaster planci]|uniref:Heparan-sulfate 6-O-sulfotransferase n=1 Tax=Acanthaster planci TaxID=133434 RepID=A0A8B7Y8Y5_ACAPL|nr:heparan-sulfate 6-O-sulfotransferase 3-like [Acanthaster planci]